jgi:hypothetical protein
MEWHFDTIATQLQHPGDGVFRHTHWLEESRRRPAEFWRALLRHHAASTPLKSNPEAGYDFYHDLVLRHHSSPHPALRWIDFEHGLRALTYAELHAACSARCAAWAAQGVRAGATLCIIAAMGPELLIALLCGLRMGLRVSLLPPLGPAFLARRLRALPRLHIATPFRYRQLLRERHLIERILIEDAAIESRHLEEVRSHTYAPDEHALALFSPLSEPQEEPILVSAATAYLGALRDGLLLLGLRPGIVLAAPEHHLLQHQPALLLATLLLGATFLHILAHDLVADGALKPQLLLHVLLVSSRVRDRMLTLPPRPLSGLHRWVVNPQEPPAQAWDDWARRFALLQIPALALLVDAALGGGCLFSLPRLGRPPPLVQPAPGLPVALLSPDDSGEPALTGPGVWDPRPGTAGLLLSPRDDAFVYAGTVAPTVHGRCYPQSEVEDLVSALPFVLGASVVPPSGDSVPVLLIFTGPEPLAHAHALARRRERALREAIRLRLGEEFLLLEILLFAMFPRCKHGRLDHHWCARHHHHRRLRHRERHLLFRLLDRLRAACFCSHPAPALQSQDPAPAPQPQDPAPARKWKNPATWRSGADQS